MSDRRQGFVASALIFVSVAQDRDLVVDPLPFSDQPRTGDRLVVDALSTPLRIAAIEFIRDCEQPVVEARAQASAPQFLQPVDQTRFKRAAIEERGVGPEEFDPPRLQFVEGERLQFGEGIAMSRHEFVSSDERSKSRRSPVPGAVFA
ncbi:hypothetical protein AAFF88_15275, partial [Hyphobacterium sp. WM6]